MTKAINIPILILVLGLTGGIYLQNSLEISLNYWIFSIIFSLLFLGILIKKRVFSSTGYIIFATSVFISSVCLGGLVTTFNNPRNIENHFSHFSKKGVESFLTAEILEKSYEAEKSIAYVAEIHSVDSAVTTGKVLLSFYPRDSINSSLLVGNLLLIKGEFNSVSPPMNPYDFDYKTYLKHHQILSRVDVDFNKYRLLSYKKSGITSLSEKVRNFIILKLKSNHFSKDVLSVTEALLLGQREDLSDTLYQNYVDSGGVHILAISGMHIGILTSILMFLLSFISFRGSNYLKIIMVTFLLWSYAFLVGMSPSVMRSVMMFSFMSVGWYLNRKKGVYDTWLLSLLFLLLYNPDFLFSVGFQLSFSAVFFIITLVPLLQKIWNPNNKILRYVVILFYVSLSAQMGVFPISLYYFHQFPALFFITNLLIIPVLGIIFSLGILTILLSTLSILPDFVKEIYSAMIRYMNWITAKVASYKEFIFQHIYFDEYLFLISFFILATTILWLKKRNIKRMYPLLISVILLQSYLIGVHYQEKNKNSIWFLHAYKNSIIARQNQKSIQFYTDTITFSVNRLVNNFHNYHQLSNISYDSIPSVIFNNDKKILVVDNQFFVPNEFLEKVDIVYLKSSPKINLERLILAFSPDILVADGSNYPSLIHRWEKTAEKRKIRFHSIAKNGSLKITNN